ncbi:unnamed protein product [Lota lota]
MYCAHVNSVGRERKQPNHNFLLNRYLSPRDEEVKCASALHDGDSQNAALDNVQDGVLPWQQTNSSHVQHDGDKRRKRNVVKRRQ